MAKIINNLYPLFLLIITKKPGVTAATPFKVMSEGVFSKTYFCEAGHSRSKYDAIENCNKLKNCDSNYRSCMIDLSACNEESLSLQSRVENQAKDLDDCNERRDYYKSVVDSWKRSVSSYKAAYKEYFHKHNTCQRQLELKKNSVANSALENRIKKYELNYNICQSSLHALQQNLNQTKEALEIKSLQFNNLQISLEDFSHEKAVLKENNLQLFQNNQKLRAEIETALAFKNVSLENNETAMEDLEEIIQLMEKEMHNQTTVIEDLKLHIANLTEQLEQSKNSNIIVGPRLISAENLDFEEASTSQISPTAAAFIDTDSTTIFYDEADDNTNTNENSTALLQDFLLKEEQYQSEIQNLNFDLNQTRKMLNESENFNNQLRQQIVDLEIEVQNLKNDQKIKENNLFSSDPVKEDAGTSSAMSSTFKHNSQLEEELARIKSENAKLIEERESLVMSNIMMSSYCNKTVAENSASFKLEIYELKAKIEELEKNLAVKNNDGIEQKTLERPVIVADDGYLYYDENNA